MADFRRYLTVLAVLALMAGAANAQIGFATGSASSLFACSASAAAIPELRPEGYTELLGDIVITCTGGPLYAVGTQIPTTNITVSISPGAPITSRFISGSASEVLLIIDEAGSSVASAVAGAGPKAPQSTCGIPSSGTVGPLCPAVVGSAIGSDGLPYEVALAAGTSNAAANVYQGKVAGDLGSQSVTFYGVPVLPPATAGVTRTYRITNIRVPVPNSPIPNVLSSPVTANIVTGANTALPISQTQVVVGVVGRPLSASVALASNNPLTQCLNPTQVQVSTLTFTEGFATAFKTRVVPGGAANLIPGSSSPNYLYAGQSTNTGTTFNQNIPGGLYGGFAQNSESGFIYPAITSTAGTAGLADFGTRLKATFYNIPLGLTVYVSNTNITSTPPAVPGGTAMSSFAVLVSNVTGLAGTSSTGDFASDGTAFSGANVAGGLATVVGTYVPTKVALTPDSSRTATATWEIINSNPSSQEVLQFGVYVTYVATAATSTNQYGLPITELSPTVPVPGQGVNDVLLSFAPEPGGGGFTAATAAAGANVIPRFAMTSIQEGKFVRIGLCQTSLLYPYITTAAGFDSGIAIANTSSDPWSTAVKQTGSCSLFGYGSTVTGAANPVAATPFLGGCDTTPVPLEGTNCFGVVPTGQVRSVMATSVFPAGFTGYVIAVCNFQYAHGYAAVTDLGLRNLWSSYLALELSPAGVGAARGFGIETLAH